MSTRFIFIWLFTSLLMRASFSWCWILTLSKLYWLWLIQKCPKWFHIRVWIVKTGFVDPLIRHVSWHAIKDGPQHGVRCKKTWWERFSDITPWGSCRRAPPTPTPWFLTRSLPLVLFHSVALPLIISSPSHPHLHSLLPSTSLSFICFLPLVLPFCQQAHLIKAESSFSALPWEWRSLGEIKCLSRKNLDQSWLKLCKLSQTNL